MRVKLTVAYDGSAYVGYQSQTNGTAIQDVLEEALTDLFKKPIRTMNASRTDTGVHALGNVSVFDVETRIPADKLAFALNMRLPEDIRVTASEAVSEDFHPRFQRTVKTYEYTILNRTHPDPTRRLYEWHVYGPLDVTKMDRAAQCLIGEHDFASFCAAGSSAKTTVRRIYDASVRREGDRVIFRITGAGFLYNMVRILAGTLVAIGKGQMAEDAMPKILEARQRSAAGNTALAKGLCLMKISYPDAATPVREDLLALKDDKYQAFSAKLIPNVDPELIIGIRKEPLRRYAASIAGTPKAEQFLATAPHHFLEENDLHMELIRFENDLTRAIALTEDMLPFIDNWETCDLPNPKVFEKHAEEMLPHIRRWLKKPQVYYRRYAVNMLMRHFLQERFSPEYPKLVAGLAMDDYYIMMSAAWYFAEALGKQYEAAVPYLEKKKLPKELHNMAIRKAIESRRIPEERKTYLRSLKR
ncbi:MAG: tRNA pseudouridine(38-40) synthase TruA [Lachnospiraceae bacterium]|nr:tRNA pseudouridine(38-40) synthase TruA [Lachnospiraceae bacterium]